MTEIFTFGSNLAGRHGAGAALFARQNHGAVTGRGVGRQGSSYAIPTKDGRYGASLSDPKQTLSIDEIRPYVDDFIQHANDHPELTFKLTAIGCGLAGYKPEQIAPLFAKAPANVIKPREFQ